MAITRAQQAKQMLQDGGRIGLQVGGQSRRGGAPGGRRAGPGTGGVGGQSRRGGAPGGRRAGPGTSPGRADDRGNRQQNLNQRNVVRQARVRAVEDFIDRPTFGFTDAAKFNLTPAPIKILKGLGNLFTGKPVDLSMDQRDGRGGILPLWAQLGFNSEAEYLASLQAQAPSNMDQEPEEDDMDDRFLRFRAEGGPIGGIMDIESGRQMYFLGKLVKKATRAVKKIAKSPIGKAALIGAAGFGIPGTTFGGLFGRAAIGGKATGLFGTQGIAQALQLGKMKAGNLLFGMPGDMGGRVAGTGLLSKIPGGGVTAAIAGTSIAAGLLTPKQELQAQRLAEEEGISIEAARNSILARAQGNIRDDFRARGFRAEGGRIGLRNGGDDDDADDQESSYDDGPLLIPDDADLSPDDFYGRKEREGIMKMASAVGDETDEISEEMFGKPVKDLNPSELEELMDYLDNLRKKFMAEGGPAEGKEPVAKKTMPLLDMGGQEMDLRAEGGFVPIGRMEKADDVPARLSKNEFVFTADAVRNAGDGDVDKGAEVMYNMMKNLEAGGDVSEESQGKEGARRMFQTSQRLEEVL